MTRSLHLTVVALLMLLGSAALADVTMPFEQFDALRRGPGIVHEPAWAEVSADFDRYADVTLGFLLHVSGRIDTTDETRLITATRDNESIDVVCPGATNGGVPNQWVAVLGKLVQRNGRTQLEAVALTPIAAPRARTAATAATGGEVDGAVLGGSAGANGVGGINSVPVAKSETVADAAQTKAQAPAAPTAPTAPAPQTVLPAAPPQTQRPAQPQVPSGMDGGALQRLERFIASRNGSLSADWRRAIGYEIITLAQANRMRWEFLAAVIAAESNFNPMAVSPAGARGLGQLMPGTAAALGVGNSFDYRQNLRGAVRYLRQHLDRYEHRGPSEQFSLALACYNAGPGAVSKYGGVPPYAETTRYIVKIAQLYTSLCAQSDAALR